MILQFCQRLGCKAPYSRLNMPPLDAVTEPMNCVATQIVTRNEVRADRYIGAAPPPGNGEHRYFFTVSALDVATLELDADSTPAVLGFNFLGHILARAQLLGVTETP